MLMVMCSLDLFSDLPGAAVQVLLLSRISLILLFRNSCGTLNENVHTVIMYFGVITGLCVTSMDFSIRCHIFHYDIKYVY